MGMLKRKTSMTDAKRRMIESVRGTSCEICKAEKPPIKGFCNRCLDRLVEDERRVLSGSPFDPRYEPAWYRALAGGGASPVPPRVGREAA